MIIRIAVILGILSTTTAAPACPAFVKAQQLKARMGEAFAKARRGAAFSESRRGEAFSTPRQHLRLFAVRKSGQKLTWQELPLQVDPLNEAGVLETPEERADRDPDSQSAVLNEFDRLVMRVEGFGMPKPIDLAPPCTTEGLLELTRAGTKRIAYLAVCRERGRPFHRATQHRPKGNLIQTALYNYEYVPTNQLLYQQMAVRFPTWDTAVPAGSKSNLFVNLDVKSFFTLDFTNDDLESYVQHSYAGNVGMVTRIDFFLRLLFFKIDLKMATTASFYGDAAHIPMIIDVPVDAQSRLHPGSGTLYHWLPDEARLTPERGNIRPVSIKDIHKGWRYLAKVGQSRCLPASGHCLFKLLGRIRDRSFSLEISVPRYMVENGFFPQYVPYASRFVDAMDWDADEMEDSSRKRMGIYFETSGLPKGKHLVDHWIRVGESDEICPKTITIGPRLPMSGGWTH